VSTRGARWAAGRAAGAALASGGVLLGLAPDASACSSCFTGDEATRQAYYATTILLGALPFLLLGALAFWLRRAARSQRPAEDRLP
jgi:hypothetical protein